MKPQDNPFAKGVSINQDMLTEEWQDAIDNGRVSLVCKGEPNPTVSEGPPLHEVRGLEIETELRYIAVMPFPELSAMAQRQLLALGREEE